jgi:hypothetical protein
MNDQRPERRRFQFGLRKLLLWTAVAALLLGTAASLREGAWLPACCILIVGAIRCAFGARVAGGISVATAVILMVSFSWVVAETHHPGPSLGDATVTGLALGLFFGLATLGIVEGAVRVVNWADKVLESKSDRATMRD